MKSDGFSETRRPIVKRIRFFFSLVFYLFAMSPFSLVFYIHTRTNQTNGGLKNPVPENIEKGIRLSNTTPPDTGLACSR